jgi:hypothetical protein
LRKALPDFSDSSIRSREAYRQSINDGSWAAC